MLGKRATVLTYSSTAGEEMKMHFMTGSIFWGSILVLLGILMILKAVFHIQIPVFRTVLALFVIYWGVKLLIGRNHSHIPNNTVIMNESKFETGSNFADYNVILGNTVIDMRKDSLLTKDESKALNIVLGSATIYLNPKQRVNIQTSNVLGSATLPNRTSSFFGSSEYKINQPEPQGTLFLEANVVLGELIVISNEETTTEKPIINDF